MVINGLRQNRVAGGRHFWEKGESGQDQQFLLSSPHNHMRLLFKLVNFNSQILEMEGKRTLQSSSGLIEQHAKIGGHFKLLANPDFIKARHQAFTQIKLKIDAMLEATPKHDISVTLKDGKIFPGQAFATTPLGIAKSISKNLADSVIVARVKYVKRYESPWGKGPVSAQAEDQQHHEEGGYELIDLTRTLQGDCELELLTFDDKAAKEVFWHSSAHLLGQSLQNNFGAWLCHGPPLDNGFFYDSFVGDYRVSQADYDRIEKSVKQFAQQKQPYQRILLTKTEALQMFAYNPFKTQLIQNKVPENGLTSAYRCGNLIDLCTGPHIPSADRVKGFKVTKNSAAYWLGHKENDDLQRVYAISFPKQSQLDDYFKQQQQMAKRDHRTIGPRQGLFNFTPLAPGCALFYPHGAMIYNKLIELMRSQYRIRGYSQVISPNVYNSELWKTSGHYFKYKQNIFFLNDDTGEENGLKPMNCPGHCVMFDMNQHSYRDLPIRMADFGVLHRNELHGALSGLTRVRRFQQDDAHIFCLPQQIQAEILGVLDLLDFIYSTFGFKYILELSTRPEKFLGSIQDWDAAELQLEVALKKFGKEYKLNKGDGAFYGPKIDVKLFDVFGREHQCGTVQLDFQLPIRFNLQYRIKEHQEGQEGEVVEKEKPEKKKKGEQPTAEEIQLRKKEKLEKKKKAEEEKQQAKELGEAKTEGKTEQEKNQLHEARTEHGKHNHPHETLEQMEERYAKVSPIRKGFARPVIIHRAIFGSLQRFIAILCEHTGGKWDFWISPRQIKLIPMSHETLDYTEMIYNTLLLKGYAVQVDHSGDNFNKKIRNAVVDGFNYIGVIGKEQANEKVVNLRKRDQDKEMGKFTIAQLLEMFDAQQPKKSRRRVELEHRSI